MEMNVSDESEKPASGFKDIDFNESPKIPQSATFNPPLYQPPIVSYQAPPAVQSSHSTDVLLKFERIEMHSRIVKWTSLVLSIFSFLFLLPGAVPLIATFIFPILGFIAAHKYDDCLTRFYTIYLFLINIVQIIVMAVLGGVAYIIFQVLVMCAEILVLIYNIKLTKEISELTQNEKNILHGGQSRNIA